jgi:hypothetical protein
MLKLFFLYLLNLSYGGEVNIKSILSSVSFFNPSSQLVQIILLIKSFVLMIIPHFLHSILLSLVMDIH